MDYLQTLLDSSEIPVITALLLGLLTTISPCPLATHITAIGFISKDVNNRNQIFLNGIFYTLGRILSYSVLGAILITLLRNGSEMFFIQKAISRWSELLLAPALILIGLFMLFRDKLALPRWGFSATEKTERLRGNWGSMALGLLFALAFCPTSGLFYFGMLIPMSAMESGGYLLPVVYAFATGFPIVLHGSSSVPQDLVKIINENGGKLKNAIGISEEQLREAAKSAVCKINIDSDGRLAMTAAIRKVFNEKPEEFDPRKYLGPARDALKELYKHKVIYVLGSAGHAYDK